MSDETTSSAITQYEPTVGASGIMIASAQDLKAWSELVHQAGLAPPSLNTTSKIAVATQFGLELGFTPMRALQCVHVIHGKTGIEGKTMLAVLRAHPMCKRIRCGTGLLEGQNTGWCMGVRADDDEEFYEYFSQEDAQIAKLWGSTDTWKKYWKDLLMWKAVSRMANRNFSDVLMGVAIVEDLRSDPIYARNAPKDVTPQADEKSDVVEKDPIVDPLLDEVDDAEIVTEEETPDPNTVPQAATAVRTVSPKAAAAKAGAAKKAAAKKARAAATKRAAAAKKVVPIAKAAPAEPDTIPGPADETGQDGELLDEAPETAALADGSPVETDGWAGEETTLDEEFDIVTD